MRTSAALTTSPSLVHVCCVSARRARPGSPTFTLTLGPEAHLLAQLRPLTAHVRAKSWMTGCRAGNERPLWPTFGRCCDGLAAAYRNTTPVERVLSAARLGRAYLESSQREPREHGGIVAPPLNVPKSGVGRKRLWTSVALKCLPASSDEARTGLQAPSKASLVYDVEGEVSLSLNGRGIAVFDNGGVVLQRVWGDIRRGERARICSS